LATRIQLCGRVTAELEGQRVEGDLPGRQGRLLFVYLVVNRRRVVPRDELAEALWPQQVPATSEGSLSALLSKLRRVLGAGRLEGRAELQLMLPGDAWVDLEAATEALHRAESAVARCDWAAAWGPGRVAQHVAARGFLPGEDAPWIEDARRRLGELHVRALELVGRACVGLGGAELDTAERSARSLIERAPYRESGHRLLMETLAAQGNPAEALVVYERLRSRLREDLGASPSRETQDLHRRVLGHGH
jgi:SARP family transcriptional regulator, regulator of embCAB operon